jgi:hypothetical protein
MLKIGNCDYRITVPYDIDPEGSSLDHEIDALYAGISNIAESYRCSLEADIYEIGGDERSW